MLFRVLSDLVIVFHFAFIVYVLLGGLLGLWRKWCLLIHLPAALWGVIVEFEGWICPLTPLENYLRFAGGLPGNQGGFVEQYLLPIIYPRSLTSGTQWILGGIAAVVNIGIYWFVLSRRKNS